MPEDGDSAVFGVSTEDNLDLDAELFSINLPTYHQYLIDGQLPYGMQEENQDWLTDDEIVLVAMGHADNSLIEHVLKIIVFDDEARQRYNDACEALEDFPFFFI